MSTTLIPNHKVRYFGPKIVTRDTDGIPVEAITKCVTALEALRWQNYQLAVLRRASQAPAQKIGYMQQRPRQTG